MSGRFTIKKTGDQFQFSLLAPNGDTVLSSERYQKKSSATNGIQSVIKNATNQARYQKKVSKANQPYFVLKAGNHEIIGTSPMYASEAARDAALASVVQLAPSAPIADETKA